MTMAEVVAVAGVATSFHALFKGLLDLVAAFRTAYEDVKTAPGKTKELADQVDIARTTLKNLQKLQVSSGSAEEELLTPPFTALGEQLLLALDKVQNDEQRKKNGQPVALAMALFGRGASKQNKSTEKIRDRIRELMVDLTLAVTVVTALRIVPLVYQTTKHALVSMLDFLAMENDDHSCWQSVYFETDPRHTSSFPIPTKIKEGLGAGSTRAAREGGYEVRNSTKLWFTINYDGHAYFYIVVYDKSLNDAPELFFPKNPKRHDNDPKRHDNELQRSLARVFPDKEEYSGDPLSFKLERADRTDGTLTKDWEQWVYLILSNEPLHTASTPVLKIEDLQHKLSEMLQKKSEDDDTEVETMEEEEEDDKFIAVKRYIFDIK